MGFVSKGTISLKIILNLIVGIIMRKFEVYG